MNSKKSSSRPIVECDKQHPTLTVSQVPEAARYYEEKLGFQLGFLWGEPPRFAGMNLGDVQIFLQEGEVTGRRSDVFFVVGDADELLEFQRRNGVEVMVEIGDREYGLRDYRVRDLWGNELSFGHYIPESGPALTIERVDVSVRLEKRLAGLLTDLATHKGMNVGNCLEETLLHTFEKVGEGVASPHTKRTLKYIQELKKKHGIDYDVHASYRFVER